MLIILVKIGEFSFVGAGSVVTKNIASFSLVVGNPAKHLYYVSKFGEKIDFDSNGFWYCDKRKSIIDYLIIKLLL